MINDRASICRMKSSAKRQNLWMPWVVKNEGKWSDIRTVYSGIGQDTVVVTPISMLRAVASIGMRGRMYVPHFLKEFRPIGAVGTEGENELFCRRGQDLGFSILNRS